MNVLIARLQRGAWVLILGVAAVALAPATASAGFTYSFHGITNNRAADTATGEAQLFVEVMDAGSSGGTNYVDFKFTNTGPKASSITDIYFDDGTLMGITTIFDGPGVNFEIGAAPKNLPGGNNVNPKFETTKGFFSADSESPTSHKGVNPDEWVTIRVGLINGQTYSDTIAALTQATGYGGLRIGIHVQAFQGGGSESFINNPTYQTPPGPGPDPSPVPAPAGMVLALSGFAALGLARLHRFSNLRRSIRRALPETKVGNPG
jgi:hypothetical protein